MTNIKMLAFKLGLVLASVALCSGGNVVHNNSLARDIRVVNGEDAAPGEFPFLASLQLFDSYYCGCTILNSEWVLTASQCSFGIDMRGVTIRAGSNNWRSGGSVHSIVEGYYHVDFVNSSSLPNDIAVMKVTPPFEWSDLVQPTVLAKFESEVSSGTPSVVPGWGAITGFPGAPVVDDMQRADVLTYSDKECLSQYGGSGPTEKNICAGGDGTGICSGDTGGPLLVNGVQVGISSWSRMPCAQIAAVWTQVSYYRGWIWERTGA